MEEFIRVLALALGLSWGSGLNLYATAAMLGILGTTGQIDLPEGLKFLMDPQILTAAIIMYCIEFFADKIPIIDSVWDGIHSFIRVPMGATLMSHAVGQEHSVAYYLAFVIGGLLSGVVHVAKAGTRILANTSPEPYSNWFLSFSEDILVVAGLWTALHYPIVYLVLIVVFFVFLFYLLPFLWRAILGEFVELRLNLNKKHMA